MIEEEYIDLINKEIDGVNSPKKSAKLKQYLAENPEAKNLYHELLTVSNMLKEIETIEPSDTLKKRVLNSNPMEKYRPEEKKYAFLRTRDFLRSLIPSPISRFNVKYAFAFSAGLILGITILSIFIDGLYKKSELDISDLYGTMMLYGTSEDFEPVDHIELNFDEVVGEINVKYSTDIVLVELTIETQHEIEIVFEFDDSDIGFSGFTRLNNEENNLRMGKNYLKLSNIGNNRYIIVFHDKTDSVTPMNFKIFSTGDLFYEKAISTGKKSG